MSVEIRPIILVGAARSGTKILRDALSRASGIPAIPYDVGYVWRYGNEGCSHDGLDPDDVRPRTSHLVRSFLAKHADSEGRIIEKTVGNTLRVPYVAKIIPEAAYVHVIRDGVDVAESARREWKRGVELRYLLRKGRYFPLRLVPTYGRKFLWSNTVGRRLHQGEHVSTWGPRYPGIDLDLQGDGLLAVTARQWRASVEAGCQDLAELRNRVEIRYEHLASDPTETLRHILETIDQPYERADLNSAAAMIQPGRSGSGRIGLTVEERELLQGELGDLLKELGYDPV